MTVDGMEGQVTGGSDPLGIQDQLERISWLVVHGALLPSTKDQQGLRDSAQGWFTVFFSVMLQVRVS